MINYNETQLQNLKNLHNNNKKYIFTVNTGGDSEYFDASTFNLLVENSLYILIIVAEYVSECHWEKMDEILENKDGIAAYFLLMTNREQHGVYLERLQ